VNKKIKKRNASPAKIKQQKIKSGREELDLDGKSEEKSVLGWVILRSTPSLYKRKRRRRGGSGEHPVSQGFRLVGKDDGGGDPDHVKREA